MKILELHYSTSWAGAERFVVDLSNELNKTEEVILCIIEDDNNPQKAYYKKEINTNIKYINLKCKSGLQIKALWRIYKTIKKIKPDIVHAHTDLICLFLPAIFYPTPLYFHTLHSLAQLCLYKKFLKPLYSWFYKHKITPITISKACETSFNHLYGKNHSVRIDNGRSPLSITNLIDNASKEVNNLKIHTDDKVFIHIARCQPVKNQILLINSFNQFLKEKHHGILIIIGAGFDNPQYSYILKKANKGIFWLGVKNNVCDYLHQADYFILSSKNEGLPISLLEAISCGVIPICTPAGGIPDVLKEKEYGYISTGFSTEEFLKAIKEAYYNTHNCNKKILIQYFNQFYSMQICTNNYITLFNKRLNDKKQN